MSGFSEEQPPRCVFLRELQSPLPELISEQTREKLSFKAYDLSVINHIPEKFLARWESFKRYGIVQSPMKRFHMCQGPRIKVPTKKIVDSRG
jgi:hypothetical protein